MLRRYLRIHFPHKVSSLAREIAHLPAAIQALTDVIGPNVKMMQSMLFIKSERKPGQAWHQDETHIPTRDRSLTAVWIALDDATTENGCLWVIPGSHQARAGLVFDGYLLHRSLPNSGRQGTRRALVNHYMSAESLLP